MVFFILLNENSRQSTHPTGSISLLSWRLSGLIFDDIIADRTSVIHDIRPSHIDPKIFGVYFFSFDGIKHNFSTMTWSVIVMQIRSHSSDRYGPEI